MLDESSSCLKPLSSCVLYYVLGKITLISKANIGEWSSYDLRDNTNELNVIRVWEKHKTEQLSVSLFNRLLITMHKRYIYIYI